MRRAFTKIIFMLLCTLFIQVAFAREYYISTTGNDSNSGSEAAPYASIQKAIDEATPGEVIYRRGGTYKPAQRILINKSGTSDNRISLFGYPCERVIIDGSEMSPSKYNIERHQGVNYQGGYIYCTNSNY